MSQFYFAYNGDVTCLIPGRIQTYRQYKCWILSLLALEEECEDDLLGQKVHCYAASTTVPGNRSMRSRAWGYEKSSGTIPQISSQDNFSDVYRFALMCSLRVSYFVRIQVSVGFHPLPLGSVILYLLERFFGRARKDTGS